MRARRRVRKKMKMMWIRGEIMAVGYVDEVWRACGVWRMFDVS